MRWRMMAFVAAGLVGLPDGTIVPNDNRVGAGTLRDGVLSVRMVATRGTWYPEERHGPGHDLFAFGEEGKAPSIPGPLIRVRAGTTVRLTLRNAIADAPLAVHGLYSRPGPPMEWYIPAGTTDSVRFTLTAPGTYFYWGSTRGAGVLQARYGEETQLLGVIVVDPPGPVPEDHIFVLGIEDELGPVVALRKLRAAVINGRTWPHSQTRDVQVGDTLRMRWVNPTARAHPIHLHGFYFNVRARGDLARDTIYTPDEERLAVTEFLTAGQTMSVTWVPTRVGNWLMHCHIAAHLTPALRRGTPIAHAPGASVNHSTEVMSGLVIGWRVRERGSSVESLSGLAVPTPAELGPPPSQSLRLFVQSSPARFGTAPAIGFALQQGDRAPAVDSVVVPGPPLILTRDQPTQITVINRITAPTSIHWHGIELDSYFDGVSGWSGSGSRLAPVVAPGDSFAVRFTPPRAGTFIYHTHLDEEHQLSSGMYGALIVLPPGERYDAEHDRVWIVGQDGPQPGTRPVINGAPNMVIDLEVGVRYRVRLINISPNAGLTIAVQGADGPLRWQAIAKDGADLPRTQATERPMRQRIGVGETYDFVFTPDRIGEFEIVTPLVGLPSTRLGTLRVRAKGSGLR